MSDTCAGTCNDGSPCGNYPLEGHDKCRMHTGKTPDGSSHDKNQNAASHGLYSDIDAYYQDLNEYEQTWVQDFTRDLLDRFRRHHGKEPDQFDTEALKNIATDFHRIAHANGWFREKGMSHIERKSGEDFSQEEIKINVWASEIRQYNESIYRRMQKHGLLDDPESEKAEAMGDISVDINRTEVTEDNVDEFTGS